MRPGKHNLFCPQGTTFAKTLTYEINDVPVNLTGYGARLQVREFFYSPDYTLALDSSSGSAYIYTGGSAGTININVPPGITEDIVPGDYVYDIEIYTSENVYRLLEGKFIVGPEVTR